ncbi:DUF5691 domain-containing protein [Bradyrhizobium sp. 170]|uniref:DUF5691 domain-containing protein n=1 Tax=Bradyrhizobium sp. 170 TaxID=2782641 RepID=UPI001FFF2720|nr:DUF5691 domain-containing protein [Bradyrhizobium sp. 170]UPK00758.1 hypothetical protein IVB05_23790 [Bradyrhizobium sp. 170]
MAEAIYDAMGSVLTRWTMGSAAAPAAPVWSAELGTEPAEAELRLLALSGQFLGIAVTAEPPPELRVLPDIPPLALPTVPEALRPLVQRILAAFKETQRKTELLDFLAARGWTTHPAEWMPTANDEDAPDVYAPWRDWAGIAASNSVVRRQAGDQLTADNWEDFWPAARKVALTELRRRDPEAARMVLEAKLANENADVRLPLLSLLATGLSEADVPFLEGLAANDRAPKVKALAASLLARLGRGPAVGEDIAELAGFFSVKMKGLLRRARVIQFENNKTHAQAQRRAALLASADITSLARALTLTPQELVDAWSWDVDRQADAALADLVSRTGTDSLVAQTAEAMSQGDASVFLAALTPRLPPGRRSELAEKVLRTRGFSFDVAKTIAGGTARLENPLTVPAGEVLLTALRRDDAKPSDELTELFALGLIASRAAARQVLERLNGAGLLQGDPRLDMLRLNAALDDNGAKP